MKSRLYPASRVGYRLLYVLLLVSSAVFAQPQSDVSAPGSQPEVASKIERLTRSLEQTQVELAQSRTEIQQLRVALQEMLTRINAISPEATNAQARPEGEGAPLASSSPQQQSVEPRGGPAQVSQDDWDILNARVEEQRQTKVESASKYRVKLSGIALFNAFGNFGQVDNADLPSISIPKIPGYSAGSAGASVRQSIVGLSGIGPVLFGARTSADLQMDFFGGLPSGYGPTSSGLAEVRLARIRFDWKNTSAVAGLDYPFFSPNLPTTYMTVVVPGFASAGNLWTWTPTVRVEQRFGGPGSPFKLEAGLLDPSANINYTTNNNLRAASPTESSRIPTFATRFSYNRKSEERPISFGVSGVYSPQEFFGIYHQTGWAAVADWKFALLPRTELSGQFFAGRGIDGVGGVPENPYPLQNQFLYTAFTGRLLADVGVIGGWSQLKFRWSAQHEFNVAAGTGGRISAALRRALIYNFQPQLVPARNQMMFANYIFRPRSDLLFSAEYRRLRTYEITGSPDSAGQFALAIGFLF